MVMDTRDELMSGLEGLDMNFKGDRFVKALAERLVELEQRIAYLEGAKVVRAGRAGGNEEE